MKRTALAAGALFAVNAFLTFPLFFIPYTTWMGSIEASYIGLARYITHHLGQLAWFPLWYGGIPYPDTYPPLLHFVDAAVSALFHISPALAYHAVTATVYSLGPVTFFWAAYRLGAPRPQAWFAALGYSLISPSCFLVRAVRADSGGFFGPRRLVTLIPYGEGPHLTSLLFLPLAVGLVHVALEKRRPIYYVAASLAVAAVVLSNWIGAFALALALSAYLLSFSNLPNSLRAAFPSRDREGAFTRPLRAAAIGVCAYAVAMPWMTPSTLATIRANAPFVGGRFLPNLKLELAFAAGLLLTAWLLHRLALAPRLRFGLLLLYSTAFITLSAYYFHLALLPQPERYHLEMDMAFWFAVAATPSLFFSARFSASPRLRVVFASALLLAALPILLHQHRRALDMEKPIAIQSTAEYKISTWLAAHPQGRVFAPGTICFWMDAFSETPMINGGFDNGERNTFLQDIIYQLYAGDQASIALDWLRAFGVDAVVGGAKDSSEVYHPYAHPDRFAALPELWREGPEVIYSVPRRRPGLAHALRAADLPPTPRPPSYYTVPLQPYLAALEDPSLPPVSLTWRTPSAATITGDLRPNHLLSVQITYDQGWHARVAGHPRPVRADSIGQMIVEPQCDGPCTVELYWDGGLEALIARWVSRLALAAGLLWILLRWRRPAIQSVRWPKRSDSMTTN